MGILAPYTTGLSDVEMPEVSIQLPLPLILALTTPLCLSKSAMIFKKIFDYKASC
jgi:hypothetical protein